MSAADEYQRLKEAAREDPAARVRLADRLVAAGRAEEAVRTCERWLQAWPEETALRLALARALSAAGQLDEAQEALRQAAEQKKRQSAPTVAPDPPEGIDGPDGIDGTDPAMAAFDEPPTNVSFSPASEGSEFDARTTPYRPGMHAPARYDLDAIAEMLHGDRGRPAAPLPIDDPVGRAFIYAIGRLHAVVWGFVLVVIGALGVVAWHHGREMEGRVAARVADALRRGAEATYPGDLTARDDLVWPLKTRYYEPRHLALAAIADARLYADDGDPSGEVGAAALLLRAERERRPRSSVDPMFAAARALLLLGHGESCTNAPLPDESEIGPRCALRAGDRAGATRALAVELAAMPVSTRALLLQAGLDADDGELDRAEGQYQRVLAQVPRQPLARAGLALLDVERGRASDLGPLPAGIGPVASAWWHLALGAQAIARGDAPTGESELVAAQPGMAFDGRLAARLGLLRMDLGKVSDAEHALKVASHLSPSDPDVAVLDAEIAIGKGFEQKVADGLAGREGPPRLLAVRGRAELLSGRPREAAATLAAALGKLPGDVVAESYHALAEARLGQAAQSIATLRKLAVAHPLPTTPYFALGLIAFDHHQLTPARDALVRATELNPETSRAGLWLGKIDLRLGRTADAVTELEKVTHDDPALVEAHALLGEAYRGLGRHREAVVELRHVVALDPHADLEVRLTLAESTLALGEVDEAQKLFADPRLAGAPASRLARDRALIASWRDPRAAAATAKLFDKQHRHARRDFSLLLDAAGAWRRASDARRALADARAAAAGPDKLHAQLAEGRALAMMHDANGAEIAYRAALASWHPPAGEDDRTEARVGLAQALIARRAYADADRVLEAAETDDPDAPEPHYWAARAALGKGQGDEARTQTEKAVELDDSYVDAWLLLGEITHKSDPSAARKAWHRFLELAPDHPEARSIRRRLAAL